jgi:hypothetical protein
MVGVIYFILFFVLSPPLISFYRFSFWSGELELLLELVLVLELELEL